MSMNKVGTFFALAYRVIQDIDDVPRENNNYEKSCAEVQVWNEFQ